MTLCCGCRGATGALSESGLYHLLLSRANEVADPAKTHKVFMDMTKSSCHEGSEPMSAWLCGRPRVELPAWMRRGRLPHYFVHASHKSYLAEHADLTFPASAEMIARSLLLGCRFLELDLWDGTGGEPEAQATAAAAVQLPLPAASALLPRRPPSSVMVMGAARAPGGDSAPTGP